jgi:uncharacterized protein
MSADTREPVEGTAHPIRASRRPDRVTAVVQHEVRSDAIANYEAWLGRINRAAAGFPGHRGVEVVRSPEVGSTRYTVAVRFDTVADAERWFDSTERHALMDEAAAWMLKRGDVSIVSGIEFWFDPPPGRKSPKPWKQFLVTLTAIYPLTVLIPLILTPMLTAMPDVPLLQRFIVTACVVALMVWFVMPRFTKAVAGWLYA